MICILINFRITSIVYIAMYNLGRIARIEIIKVAKAINLDVNQKKAMCYNGHYKISAGLSFKISKNAFKCFGCNDRGSVIDLVSKTKKH